MCYEFITGLFLAIQFLEYDAMLLGQHNPTFQRNIIPSPSRAKRSLQNFGNYSLSDTVTYPRRQESLAYLVNNGLSLSYNLNMCISEQKAGG